MAVVAVSRLQHVRSAMFENHSGDFDLRARRRPPGGTELTVETYASRGAHGPLAAVHLRFVGRRIVATGQPSASSRARTSAVARRARNGEREQAEGANGVVTRSSGQWRAISRAIPSETSREAECRVDGLAKPPRFVSRILAMQPPVLLGHYCRRRGERTTVARSLTTSRGLRTFAELVEPRRVDEPTPGG